MIRTLAFAGYRSLRELRLTVGRLTVILVSHADALVDAISSARDATRIELSKEAGETFVTGRRPVDEPTWKWTA